VRNWCVSMSTLSSPRQLKELSAGGMATTYHTDRMVYGIDPVGAGFIKSLAHPAEFPGDVRSSPLIYGKKLSISSR